MVYFFKTVMSYILIYNKYSVLCWPVLLVWLTRDDYYTSRSVILLFQQLHPSLHLLRLTQYSAVALWQGVWSDNTRRKSVRLKWGRVYIYTRNTRNILRGVTYDKNVNCTGTIIQKNPFLRSRVKWLMKIYF